MEEQQLQVCKSNALVEASFRLSIYEQRIILAAIAQIRRDQPLTDQHLYRVTAKQIADLSDTQIEGTYVLMKDAVERLFERRVQLHRKPNGGPPRVLQTRWVPAVEYIEQEGAVGLQFATRMLPYLVQLSEHFTRYALADVGRMTSGYAIRFYELVVQWRGTEKHGKGERLIEIEWLREALQLEGKFKPIGDLKRWVIEPSIKQINKHTPLKAEWEQRKTGRKITHILLKWHEKPKPKSAKEKPKTNSPKKGDSLYGIPIATIEAKARPGESYEEAAIRLLQEAQKK